jgi:predicted transcriptional regulator
METLQMILDNLERAGLIQKNGELRSGKDGRLEPVYVASEFATGERDGQPAETAERCVSRDHDFHPTH